MPTCFTLRFNLVCDNEDKQKFLGTLMMSGLLVGSVVGGLSGDYFGRKRSLYAATLVMAVSIGTAATFVLFNLPDEITLWNILKEHRSQMDPAQVCPDSQPVISCLPPAT